jgi:hypothetical protein
MRNVYYKVGYWPDEYYRFGIVFVYNNNQLSPAFNIQGYDAQATASISDDALENILWNKQERYEFQDYEPDDYFFNKHIFANSKGVFKTNAAGLGTLNNPINIGIEFITRGLAKYI